MLIVAVAMCHSPFGDSIRTIIGTSTKKQVIGSHTGRCITMMTNYQLWKYRAVVKCIRKAVCQLYIVRLTQYGKHTISPLVLASNPEPARISLINLRPKAILNRLSGLAAGKMEARRAAIISFYPRLTHKYFAAYRASSFRCWYNLHINSPYLRVDHAGDVCASPGLSIPNYSTFERATEA